MPCRSSRFTTGTTPHYRISLLAIFAGIPTQLALIVLLIPCVSQSAIIDWSSTAGTTAWATGANWDGAAAPANDLTTDIARFNKTSYLAQPNSGTRSISGIQIGDGTTATATLTLTNTALSIGSNGIAMFANAGAATLTGGSVKIGANQSWSNNSSNLLTISSAVTNTGNITPFMLTLSGSGTGGITISGVISDGGTTGTTALTVNRANGTTTLSGSCANTFTGATTINAGVLALNKTSGTDAIAGSLIIGDNSSPSGTATVRLLATNEINDASAVTVNSSGVLDLNGFSEKVGAITIYSGTSAASSITTGAGILTLGGDITMIVSGTGATGVVISGNIKDGGANRTITVDDGTANADLTISAVMQGSKNYIKAGAGRLVLSAANTNSGVFTINAGQAQLQNADALSSGTAVVNTGGALELTGGISFNAFNLTLNGTGVGATGALLNVSGNNTLASNITLGSDALIESSSGTLTLSGTINNGGFLLTVGGTGNITTSGIISGAGGLTKIDSGTLTLTGGANNTYSGLTTVNDGTLQLNMTAGKNAANGNFTVGDGTGSASSAVMRWLASNQVPNKLVTVNSDGLVDLNNFSDAIGALTMTSGSVTTGTGTLTLGGTVTGNASSSSATISGNLALGGNRTFTIADGSAAQDMSVSAIVSGGNTVTKNGTGTLVFSGANTYTGATTVSAGVLNIQNATGLGTTAAGTTVSSGATLQLQGGITVGAETLNITGTGASGQTGALVNSGGTNNYGGLLTLAGATTLSSDSGTLNLTNAGTITGATFGLTLAGAGNGSISSIIGTTSGAVIKNGAGTWTLTGVNTYTGGTTINGGTVAVNSSSNLGAITGGLTINAGTLEILTGYTTTRTITLGDVASTFQVDPSQTFTASTAIGGSGSLTKTGTGTMVLGATETYSGSTTVSAGTLQINASNRIPDASNVTVSGGTLDVQTFTDTVGTVTLSNAGSIIGSGAGTVTASSYSLQDGSASAILAGSGTITKNTSGTVTLTGANTMSGAVTINGGTLNAAASSGSALGSVSSITVNSGGTLLLGANNQINNSAGMTLAGGTFAKGSFNEGSTIAAGLGALTLTASGSHLDFSTGTVGVLRFASFNPGSNLLTIDNWTGTANTQGTGSTDRLIFESDQTSNLGAFTFTGYSGAVEFALGGGLFEIVPMTAVPEPSTYAFGTLTFALLVRHWRKRRR